MADDEPARPEPLRILLPGIPPGVDPGGEKTPEGVLYFRVFAGVVLGISALLVVAGVMALARAIPHGGAVDSETVLAAFELGFGVALSVPFAIVLFGGRRPWVHTVGTLALALSMLLLCCLPVSLPLLIAWANPETRRYYVARPE